VQPFKYSANANIIITSLQRSAALVATQSRQVDRIMDQLRVIFNMDSEMCFMMLISSMPQQMPSYSSVTETVHQKCPYIISHDLNILLLPVLSYSCDGSNLYSKKQMSLINVRWNDTLQKYLKI